MKVAILIALILGQAWVQVQGQGQGQGQGEWVEFYRNFWGAEFKDLDGWVATNAASNNLFYTCGRNNMILGGPYAFGKSATLSRHWKMPSHYQIQVQVRLYKLDTWDNERMIILADGFQWETLWGYSFGGTRLCAGAAPDGFHDVTFEIGHDQPSFNLIFTSTLDEDASNESWGIKNLVISYKACPSECGVCSGSNPDACKMWMPNLWNWFNPKGPEDWSITGGQLVANSCAGIPFVGGTGKLGSGAVVSRIINQLPPHYKLKFQFQFWKIDSWDNELAYLYVDKNIAWQQAFSWNEGVELCYGDNSGWPEKLVNVNQEVYHTFDAVLLEFKSTLDESADNESYGLRQFYLWYAKCADNCAACTGPSDAECTACVAPYTMRGGVCVDDTEWVLKEKVFDTNGFNGPEGWLVQNVWSEAKQADKPVTVCQGVKMLGGFELFGKGARAEKAFTGLPKHTRLRIKAEVWKVDFWDAANIFMMVDGVKVWERKFGWNEPNQSNQCKSQKTVWNENKVNFQIILPHVADAAKVEFGSTLEQEATTQSWGFRDFAIFTEVVQQCAVLFSECNYQGEQFQLCDEVPNFQLKKYPSIIKSIQVPNGHQVVLWDESEFKGLKVEFTSSQPCINNMKFSLAQLYINESEQIEHKESSQELSHNKKHKN